MTKSKQYIKLFKAYPHPAILPATLPAILLDVDACFPAVFKRLAGNLLSVDGSATQLPAILLAILLDTDAPLQHRYRYFVHLIEIKVQ